MAVMFSLEFSFISKARGIELPSFSLLAIKNYLLAAIIKAVNEKSDNENRVDIKLLNRFNSSQ